MRMRNGFIVGMLALLIAALASAQVAEYRQVEPIYITAASGDTTITIGYDVVGVQIYPYQADQWASYSPGGGPFKVPAERAFSVPALISTLTIHRDGTSDLLVTLAHK